MVQIPPKWSQPMTSRDVTSSRSSTRVPSRSRICRVCGRKKIGQWIGQDGQFIFIMCYINLHYTCFYIIYIYCTCVYVIIPWKNEVTTTTVLSRQCSKKDFLEQRRVKLVSHEALGDNRPYWTWEFIMARNPPASKLGGLMCQQRTQILDVIEGHIEFLSHPTHSIHSTS